MKYLKKVSTAEDIANVEIPSVYFITSSDEVKYFGFEHAPFFMVAKDDYLDVKFSKEIDYSFDGKSWTTLAANAYAPTVNHGQKIYFRRITTSGTCGKFTTNRIFDVGGNIMSLSYGEDYFGKTTLRCDFNQLLAGSYVESAALLLLPATEIVGGDYRKMFMDCTSLIEAPNLPAKVLSVESCYESMFQDCISLEKAPELPATTLSGFCYNNMFYGCTSLKEAPKLPATSIKNSCYNGMFGNCTSLEKAPALPAMSMYDASYANMFNGCTSLKEAPELPATSLYDYCYDSMFSGCTSLEKAPELPATMLAYECYYYMFNGCTSLKEAPKLPAPTLEEECYYKMFNGCSSLSRIEMLATSLGSASLDEWVTGVAPSGVFVKKASLSLPSGDSGIPNGWTVENV